MADGPAEPSKRRAVNRPRNGHRGAGPARLLVMIAVAWAIYAVFFRDW